jgi:hypothetical protein
MTDERRRRDGEMLLSTFFVFNSMTEESAMHN